jgi:osmoprotectant transport system permease protein
VFSRREIGAWSRAQHGVTTLGPLGFENAHALAMQGDAARAKGIASIEDLRAAAGLPTLSTDLESPDRPDWATIRQSYGLRFARQRTFNPTFFYDALKSGDADVISAFSSDGRISADGLVVLTDPRGAIPSYDALLLEVPGPRATQSWSRRCGPWSGRSRLTSCARRTSWSIARRTSRVPTLPPAGW